MRRSLYQQAVGALRPLATCVVMGWGAAAFTQAVPVVTTPAPYEGFRLPDIKGTLSYSLSASESVLFGYNGQPGSGANAYTNFSGNLAYLSQSTTKPTSIVYSGGYLLGTSNQRSDPFQNLSLSQSFRSKSWNLALVDSVSYLPETPSAGLSGIPGVGDLGITPAPVTTSNGLGILTTYNTQVSNVAGATLTRFLTGSTSVTGTGSYSIQRFTGDGVGLDSNQTSATASVQHRIDARDSFGVGYTYSKSTYQNSVLSFYTQGGFLQYTREFTRRLTASVSAGPQYVGSGNNTISAPSTNLQASATVNYELRRFHTSVLYSRGVNNGSGVLLGARSDSLDATISGRLNRVLGASALVGYNHSTSLASPYYPSFSNQGIVASGQLSRSLGRFFSVFGSYTIERQGISGTSAVPNAFNGLSQIASFGITYSPRPFLGR